MYILLRYNLTDRKLLVKILAGNLRGSKVKYLWMDKNVRRTKKKNKKI